jgi:hypothetical protein
MLPVKYNYLRLLISTHTVADFVAVLEDPFSIYCYLPTIFTRLGKLLHSLPATIEVVGQQRGRTTRPRPGSKLPQLIIRVPPIVAAAILLYHVAGRVVLVGYNGGPELHGLQVVGGAAVVVEAAGEGVGAGHVAGVCTTLLVPTAVTGTYLVLLPGLPVGTATQQSSSFSRGKLSIAFCLSRYISTLLSTPHSFQVHFPQCGLTHCLVAWSAAYLQLAALLVLIISRN